MTLEERARRFATKWHGSIDQRRKYTNEPYIHHASAVAAIVRRVTDDQEMLAAAWLHDVVEDTPCSLEEIEQAFGAAVAALVAALTSPSRPEDGDRAERKAIDLAHLAKAPPRAKTIKLADIIDNTSTVRERDPAFAEIYLAEKRAQLDVLLEGDATLWREAKDIVG